MFRTLDRYIVREIVPPFLIALAVFTFLLAVQPTLDYAEQLLAKSVPLGTVGILLLTLLPQALGLTIPMAFLTGTLMAMGRFSGDREGVALLACGVSPMRLLRPVLACAIVLGLADHYVLTRLIPDSNQLFREITTQLLAQKGESDIREGVFYEGFPGKVIFVRSTDAEGVWTDVMVADTTTPDRPAITLAETARLELRPDERLVNLWMTNATRYLPGADSETYDVAHDARLRFPIEAAAVFGDGSMAVTRGPAELDMADLRALAAEREAQGLSPHNEIIRIHQMFSFPVACLVFAVLGVTLGLHTRKEGKLAGFTVGLAVIFVYYGLLAQFEALTKGESFPAEWARWIPNIVLGAAGIMAVWWKMRASGHRLSIAMPAWLTRRKKAAAGAAPPTPARPVLVIRLPALSVPRPRLLDLYVSGRYLRIIALSFIGLLGLYYIGQFIELAQKLYKGSATGSMLLSYLWYSTPQFVTFLVPIATLVAVLSTIGALSRTGELTVMRACGVSLYRVALPLVLLSLLWSGGLFLIEERVLARANRVAEALEDRIRDRGPRTVNVANLNWSVEEGGRIYYYAVFDRQRDALYALSVYDTKRAPYRIETHTFARQAVFDDESWLAGPGWVQSFPADGSLKLDRFEQRNLELAEIEEFDRSQIDTTLMTYGEQRDYIAQLEASGYPVARQRVELQKKLAFPLVTVVMTLLAVPFGVTTGRRGALYGVGLAIMLAFGYWFLTTIFMAAGAATLLPATMAAWAANILFLAAAGYMLLTVRT